MKLSDKQREVLTFLAEPNTLLEHRSSGILGFFLYLRKEGTFYAPKINRPTFRSLESRKLLAEGEHRLGGLTTWTDEKGERKQHREVITIFRISDKGRKALELR